MSELAHAAFTATVWAARQCWRLSCWLVERAEKIEAR